MKMKNYYILNTENYYTGYNMEEECYVMGTHYDLYYDDDVENDTIEYDDYYYNYVKDEFENFIIENIRSYEKKYNTIVQEVVLAGSVGVWHGNYTGGKVLESRYENYQKIINGDRK